MTRAAAKLATLALAALLLTVSTPGWATAQKGELPPKLDVDAALTALRTERIYRAPGAVAYFDEELVRARLTDDMRILVAPFTGAFEEGANYADNDEHHEQVYVKLSDWAEETGLTLIRIEGLRASSSEGVSAVPSDLGELRQHTGQYDLTEAVLTLINHAKDIDTDSTRQDYPATEVVAPTPGQTAELADRLREHRVYNAPGREDLLDLPLDLIAEKTGFTVRAAAFPVAEPREPIIDYAPALAERFPEDVVLVVHGDWLELAGPHIDELLSARDYAYGRYQQGPFLRGLTMNDRIGTVLLRADRLLTEHPFGRPQPKTLRQLIADLSPWLLGGSALVLGGVPLTRLLARHAGRARADRAALRQESAETFAVITELGGQLLARDADRSTAVTAAAERHATATTLFDQATTAEAMREVRTIAEQGRKLLRGDKRGSRRRRRKTRA